MCKYTCTKCENRAYKASHDNDGRLPVIKTLNHKQQPAYAVSFSHTCTKHSSLQTDCMIHIAGILITLELLYSSGSSCTAMMPDSPHSCIGNSKATATSLCPYLIVLRLQLNDSVKYGSGSTPVCSHQIASLIHEMGNVRVGMPHEYVENRLRGS